MIKTLHLTNAWHETSGGIATFYRALMDAAARRQQPIRLIVPSEADRVEDYNEHARIYYVKATPAPLNSRYRIIYPPAFLYPKSIVQGIIATERPHLVEVCDKYNLNYLAALLRLGMLADVSFRPVVVGLSCERMDDNVATYLGVGKAGRMFSAWYMRWIYFPFFDHHIAISTRTADELRAVSDGHPVTRGVWVRPMGVDLRTFSAKRRSPVARQQLLSKIGETEDCRLLVYVGRLAPEKNLALLLETMKSLRSEPEKYALLIAGEGMERAALESAASSELPGKVRFLGYIKDREALADLLANSDVFLHSNPNEPFGIALLEAMASGLPLVAPNSGGVTEFADHSNAWLVPPTPESFALSVREIISEREVREKKVQNALSTAASFCWEQAATAFLDLYQQIHAVANAELPLEQASPLFTSKPPNPVGRTITASAAILGKRSFSAYLKLHAQFRDI
jgi:alpha-1,6-mannosyltransferase